VAFVAAAKGVLQYLANPDRDLLHRISGFMSQWMTYSGLLMLVLVALSAYIMCIGFGRSAWVLPLGFLLIVALALSLTRNSWLGALAGLTVVLALVRPRALGGLLMVIMVLLLISPGKVQYRIRSGMDLSDDNTRNRIELFSTAMRLIRDNPWFGVGPKNVAQEALRYRGTDEYPDWLYQHMHNNFLQIAAERGLPGLALWLWFIFSLIRSTWRVHRASASRAGPGAGLVESSEAFFASTAALGCCAALLVAGLFEYNFGDSEVLMLFLFIVSAPWAFPDVEAGSPA
jgi:O-antigen ligase